MRSTTTSETFLEFDETFSCRYHGCSGSKTHQLPRSLCGVTLHTAHLGAMLLAQALPKSCGSLPRGTVVGHEALSVPLDLFVNARHTN